MVDWVRLGADMEELATQTLKGAKRVTGILRPMTIQPYRGFVVDGVANVRARVREEQRFEYADDALRIDATLAANLLRWVVLDMPGVPVDVSIAGATQTATSNADGFVIAKIPVGDLAPGWHTVHFSAVDSDGRAGAANGRVVVPDPASKIAVVTDIDDTILRTGMTEGLKAVQRTLLRDAHGAQADTVEVDPVRISPCGQLISPGNTQFVAAARGGAAKIGYPCAHDNGITILQRPVIGDTGLAYKPVTAQRLVARKIVADRRRGI